MKQVWEGTLQKMRTEAAEPVRYWLEDGGAEAGPDPATTLLNPLIGGPVRVEFTGRITCTHCGVLLEQAFDNGYCYDCFQIRADADVCMMRPHLCHHGDPDNPCRDESFAQNSCFQPHYLYASLTSEVKVGITRHTNLPARWMDQGAVEATTLACLPSRREVGVVEHALAQDFRDRTHWIHMLRTESPEASLDEAVGAILARLAELGVAVLPESERIRRRFSYPVQVWPVKVKSIKLDKTNVVEGPLHGIKGQYLYLPSGVLNVRRHAGYGVRVYAA